MEISRFRRALLGWYRRNRRPLPWRENPTPYRVWISEIMLQQTRVRAAVPYYLRFLERFPDVESLAAAPESDVVALWAGLGYYGRARNLRRAARLILERHGSFPEDFAAILALPGIGRYTAGAICSLAFNQPRPVVDGNVRRVILRLEGRLRDAPEKFFWDRMEAWISRKKPSDFNQGMMELGATVCVPSHPGCPECPVQAMCAARERGIQGRIPAARASRPPHRTRIAVLVLRKGPRLLLTSSRKPAMIPGEWALPCLEVEAGESAREAASRLCRSVLGRPVPLAECIRVRHDIMHYRITAWGFAGREDPATPRLRNPDRCRWASLSECNGALTSSLFRKILLGCRAGTAGR